LAVIALLAALLALACIHGTSGNHAASPAPETASQHNNVAKLVAEFLSRARRVYTEAAASGETRARVSLSGLAETIVTDSSIVNNSFIRVDGKLYRCAVLRFYSRSLGVDIEPARTPLGPDTYIELLPRSPGITYTGGTPYSYLLHTSDESCRFTVWVIGFTIQSYKLYGYTENLCATKTVLAALFMGLDEFLWLVLEEAEE